MQITRSLLKMSFVISAACLAMPAASLAQTDAAAANDIAVQIRQQGYACEAPATAERDPGSGGVQGASWILRCKNASYRVQLVPDMAARVQQID